MMTIKETYELCGHERPRLSTRREHRQVRCPQCRYDRGMALLAKAILAFIVALVLVCIVAKVARGSEPLVTVLQRQPVYFEDRATPELKAVQLQDLATAIEAASEDPPPGLKVKDWQALLVAVSWHESTWSLRIHRGDCKPHECDGGKARGPWQQHRTKYMSDQDWGALLGLENTLHQAQVASRQLRSSYLTCRNRGLPWLTATLNNYAGRPCDAPAWDGREDREETWVKVRKRL